MIRQVTDIHRSFDVLVTADEQLIPPMMERAKDPASRTAVRRLVRRASRPPAWCSPTRPRAGWPGGSRRPTGGGCWPNRSVRLGIADPRFDAAGYRSLMVLQLAEWLYRGPDAGRAAHAGAVRPADHDRTRRRRRGDPRAGAARHHRRLACGDARGQHRAAAAAGVGRHRLRLRVRERGPPAGPALRRAAAAGRPGLVQLRGPVQPGDREDRPAALRQRDTRVQGRRDHVRPHHPDERARRSRGASASSRISWGRPAGGRCWPTSSLSLVPARAEGYGHVPAAIRALCVPAGTSGREPCRPWTAADDGTGARA